MAFRVCSPMSLRIRDMSLIPQDHGGAVDLVIRVRIADPPNFTHCWVVTGFFCDVTPLVPTAVEERSDGVRRANDNPTLGGLN